MKKLIPILLAYALIALPLQGQDKKEKERLENCSSVVQEIMDIPDNIPQDLIDKADCIIVYPSWLRPRSFLEEATGEERWYAELARISQGRGAPPR